MSLLQHSNEMCDMKVSGLGILHWYRDDDSCTCTGTFSFSSSRAAMSGARCKWKGPWDFERELSFLMSAVTLEGGRSAY